MEQAAARDRHRLGRTGHVDHHARNERARAEGRPLIIPGADGDVAAFGQAQDLCRLGAKRPDHFVRRADRGKLRLAESALEELDSLTASLLGFLSRPAPVEVVLRGDEVVSATRLGLVRTTVAGEVPRDDR